MILGYKYNDHVPQQQPDLFFSGRFKHFEIMNPTNSTNSTNDVIAKDEIWHRVPQHIGLSEVDLVSKGTTSKFGNKLNLTTLKNKNLVVGTNLPSATKKSFATAPDRGIVDLTPGHHGSILPWSNIQEIWTLNSVSGFNAVTWKVAQINGFKMAFDNLIFYNDVLTASSILNLFEKNNRIHWQGMNSVSNFCQGPYVAQEAHRWECKGSGDTVVVHTEEDQLWLQSVRISAQTDRIQSVKIDVPPPGHNKCSFHLVLRNVIIS
jgi:hypothetical protein